MDDKTIRYLPFHAINEFMRDDFRLEVVKSALLGLSELPKDDRIRVEKLCKENIQVPGFRNIKNAPVHLKIKPTSEAFAKNPQVVSAILSAWAEIHFELRQNVFDLLVIRGWEVLPLQVDRNYLPGFVPEWPTGEDFDVLYKAYIEKYPIETTNADDVSLMVVWVSGRLPYHNQDEA